MIMDGWHYHAGGGAGWMWLGGLFWLVLLAATIALIVWLVMRTTHAGRENTNDARRILDERFARGVIDEDDYRRRREILE